MHYNITTNIDVCVNDSGFSLDELGYRMSVLHKEKAFPEQLAEILMMYDGYVRLDVMQCNCIPLTCSCGGNMYVLDGRRARRSSSSSSAHRRATGGPQSRSAT